MSQSTLPDPSWDPRRLFHTTFISHDPPTLPVFLLDRLNRVKISTLRGPDDENKYCALCEGQMCNAPRWPPPEPPRQRLDSVMAELARGKNAFAAKLQKNAFDLLLQQNHQASKRAQKAPPTHTCDLEYCECPIQVLTPGCKHYVGNQCLETWIWAGQNRCLKCNTIWFQPTTSGRMMLVENYAWPAGMKRWIKEVPALNGDDIAIPSEDTLRRQIIKLMAEERIKNLVRRDGAHGQYDAEVQEAARRSAGATNTVKRSEPIDITYPRGRSPTRRFH